MIRSLAVTTDFSEASRRAFPIAASTASRFRAALWVIHVLQPKPTTPWRVEIESPLQAARRKRLAWRRLREVTGSEPAFQAARARPAVLTGEPAEAACRYVRRKGMDLLVIATHGLAGVDRFPLGSIAAKVVRSACCPVLLVRALGERSTNGEFLPRGILAPHDFSPTSSLGLDEARGWASAFGATLQVLAVVPPRLDLFAGSDGPAGEEEEERVREEARRRLESIAGGDGRGVPVRVLARSGNPAVEILRGVEEMRPDLVVMASRSAAGDGGHLLGSVTERTIHASPCPVLVVRPQAKRSRRSPASALPNG